MPNFENAPKCVCVWWGDRQKVIQLLSHYSVFFCQLCPLVVGEYYSQWEIQQKKANSAPALPYSFTLKDKNLN